MNFWASLPQPVLGLAPMDGVTDAAFRHIVSQQGPPDVTFTEFTHVNDVCLGPDYMLDSLVYSESERPIVAQLYGKNPELFYVAAHVVCELGFDGLDINMGCPSHNVASSGSGAGLIKTPDLAHAIMRAARQGIVDWVSGQTPEVAGLKPVRAVQLQARVQRQNRGLTFPRRLIPLSVKTRLGYDSVVVEKWIGHLLEERPAAISVHGRTLQQMYRGEADWAAISRAAQLVQGTSTLLLGNGDVRTMQEAVRRVQEGKVQGVLVGRGALGAPWFFRFKERVRAAAWEKERNHVSTLNEADEEVDLDERFRVLLDHARHFETGCTREGQFRRMRKHLGWYCKGFPHAAAMRANMFRASSMLDVEQILTAYRREPSADVVHPEQAVSVEPIPSELAIP